MDDSTVLRQMDRVALSNSERRRNTYHLDRTLVTTPLPAGLKRPHPSWLGVFSVLQKRCSTSECQSEFIKTPYTYAPPEGEL